MALDWQRVAEEARLRLVPAPGDAEVSFQDVVLFGQLGNGDMFFQPRVPEGTDNVFVWDHEDDSRTWYARDLEDAIRRLAAGAPR